MGDSITRSDLTIHPATSARFDDVVEMLGPKKHPKADACWCLAYRLGTSQAAKLGVEGKRDCVAALCRKRRAPGVLAYQDGEVVGWAAIAPGDELAQFADEAVYPRIDKAAVSEPRPAIANRASGRRSSAGPWTSRDATEPASWRPTRWTRTRR